MNASLHIQITENSNDGRRHETVTEIVCLLGNWRWFGGGNVSSFGDIASFWCQQVIPRHTNDIKLCILDCILFPHHYVVLYTWTCHLAAIAWATVPVRWHVGKSLLLGNPWMKSSNYFAIGHQYSNPSIDRQGDLPYSPSWDTNRLGTLWSFIEITVWKNACPDHFSLLWRHNDAMASHIISLSIVYSVVHSVQIKENIKAPCQWPLCGEFTGDRGIPRTKGQ